MKNLKLILLSLILIVLGVISLTFFISCTWIGYEVKQKCSISNQIYQNDKCVDNLISFLNDEKNSLKDRNNTIWALGQLGDYKALPVLEKYYTGAECDHNQYLCQYELEKAIRLIKSDFNLSAFVWRYNID